MFRLISFLFFLNLICTYACNKTVQQKPEIFCLPDSSKINTDVDIYFKQENGLITEARTILQKVPLHIISYSYTAGKPSNVYYYLIPNSVFTRKYTYDFNSSGLLSAFTYNRYNQTTAKFEKVRTALYNYQNSVLSELKILNFNPNDSITPASTETVTYKSRNGNIDTAFNSQWFITGEYYTFESIEKENVLLNNYFFLTDPITISENFLFDPLKTPILLNRKAVITVYKEGVFLIKEAYLRIRVGVNNFSKPEFLSWGPYKTDYYYSCK